MNDMTKTIKISFLCSEALIETNMIFKLLRASLYIWSILQKGWQKYPQYNLFSDLESQQSWWLVFAEF